VIAIKTAAGTVVGNNVTVEFTVTDAGAGVAPDKVKVAIVGSTEVFTYESKSGKWSHPDDTTYALTFNAATAIGTSLAQIAVHVTAADKVGNLNDEGVSIPLYLDQVGPIVSMDPPVVREFYTPSGASTPACSNSFDPLGTSAVNDGATVGNAPIFRALVWDDTNFIASGVTQYFALTNQTRVELFLRSEVGNAAVLVNNDLDPECDDAAASADLPALQLLPVTPTGYAPWTASATLSDFTTHDATTDGTPLFTDKECSWLGWAMGTAEHLCGGRSEMTRVIQHSVFTTSTPEPVIYAYAPISNPAAPDCTGMYLEIAGKLTGTTPATREGWHCAAVKAVDNVGNIGLSKPLRICYDDPKTAYKPDCTTPPALSTCTDGCTAPTNNIARFIQRANQ
jgi:hypothetical protein